MFRFRQRQIAVARHRNAPMPYIRPKFTDLAKLRCSTSPAPVRYDTPPPPSPGGCLALPQGLQQRFILAVMRQNPQFDLAVIHDSSL